MRLALILTAALALGCDDPDVSAKALDVLEHGFVAAQLRCQCDYGGANHHQLGLTAQKLIDGSCLLDGDLLARSDAEAPHCKLESKGVSAISATHLSASPSFFDPSAPYSVLISSCCTGFSIEAFEF